MSHTGLSVMIKCCSFVFNHFLAKHIFFLHVCKTLSLGGVSTKRQLLVFQRNTDPPAPPLVWFFFFFIQLTYFCLSLPNSDRRSHPQGQRSSSWSSSSSSFNQNETNDVLCKCQLEAKR